MDLNALIELISANPLPTVVGVLCVLAGWFLLFGGSSSKSSKAPIALNEKEFAEFPLIKIENLSHDVRKFTFGLPSPEHRLGLPIGQHITVRYEDKDGTGVQRTYTPVSEDGDLGIVVFIIKCYRSSPKFPNGGIMGTKLDSLKIGDTMLMKGPKGHVEYLGKGKLTIHKLRKPLETREFTEIGMVAGGTGLTPMLQILHAIFRDPNDKTKVKFIFANKTEEDIVCREELEGLEREFPDRFSLRHVLGHPPSSGWKYSTGYVDKKLVSEYLFPASPSTQIFLCGPPAMNKLLVPALGELGFNENQYVVF